MNIELKEIIATAWKHFRIHWLKLVSLSVVGYFLPIMALAWVVWNVFFMNSPAPAETTDPEFFDYDLTTIFGALIVLPVIIMALVCYLIYAIIATVCYTICFLIAAKVSTILAMPGLIKICTDIVNGKPISIKKSFSFSAFGKYCAYYLISIFNITIVDMFSPYIVAEEPGISVKNSIQQSHNLLIGSNFKMAKKCRLICGAINLLGIITIVGLIPAIPFTTLIKATLYKRMKSCPPPFTIPIK